MALPLLLSVPEIQKRLQIIFPKGTARRNYMTRKIAARTVFVMPYTGAIEGNERWIRPDQVTRMTNKQAALISDEMREDWVDKSMSRTAGDIKKRWFAVNTRESIRDETLRDGLIPTGAVKEREGLATTSSQPRYALTKDFAALFSPGMEGDALDNAIIAWREANLSRSALARVAIGQNRSINPDRLSSFLTCCS